MPSDGRVRRGWLETIDRTWECLGRGSYAKVFKVPTDASRVVRVMRIRTSDTEADTEFQARHLYTVNTRIELLRKEFGEAVARVWGGVIDRTAYVSEVERLHPLPPDAETPDVARFMLEAARTVQLAWKATGVLNVDLSPDNCMFRLQPGGIREHHCIPIDWDVSFVCSHRYVCCC